MEYSFKKVNIPCGFVVQEIEPGYKLPNGTLLFPSERDSDGCYMGAIGLDGIYLRTNMRYRPIYDSQQQLRAFQKVI